MTDDIRELALRLIKQAEQNVPLDMPELDYDIELENEIFRLAIAEGRRMERDEALKERTGPVEKSEGYSKTTETGQEEMSRAASDVLAERQRQISAEGWTSEHDDEHSSGEMARAAACYARFGTGHNVPFDWPWANSWWKPRDPRRNLVRSAALLLAEIERIDRATTQTTGEG